MKFPTFFVALFFVLKKVEGKFTFFLDIRRHMTIGGCGFLDPQCDTFFSLFCLRGLRINNSTDANDCPLGSRGHFRKASGMINIPSSEQWQVWIQIVLFGNTNMAMSYS